MSHLIRIHDTTLMKLLALRQGTESIQDVIERLLETTPTGGPAR